MGVRKRKLKNGVTAEYHYEFMQDGKRYCGVCEGCSTKIDATAYEKRMKETVKNLSEQKSVGALVENFKRELTGGEAIALQDAYELSLKKPRRRQPSAELIQTKRSYWRDFLAFMSAKYPDVSTLDAVLHSHAEEYVQHLRIHGRFDKVISYVNPNGSKNCSYLHRGNLSAKTINTYQQVLAEVFSLLARDAGVIQNPFTEIPMLRKAAETREAFTEQELGIIRDKADDFTFPLFCIAIATALREGDICTLKWSDIDFERDLIIRRQHKTGNYAEIPMMPPLKAYLLQLRDRPVEASDPYREYVLPRHAQMYTENSSGVSYRVKQFLEQQCGITTTKIPEGRDRAVSVKDLHSCRHTFCYYAGVYGIPLNVVQSIVGHMTPEMTKHYSAHADRKIKQEMIKHLPSFMGLAPAIENSSSEKLRQKLHDMLNRLPENKLEELLHFLEALK